MIFYAAFIGLLHVFGT